MYVLGCDPGMSGGIAFIDHRGAIVEDMPTLTVDGTGYARREIDAVGLRSILRTHVPVGDVAVAYVEQVHTMPGQGVASQAAMMETVGAIKATLRICGIPIVFVPPQRWKNSFRLPGKTHPTHHEQAMKVASNLYPELAAERLKRKKDSGRLDALLIAHYGVKQQ